VDRHVLIAIVLLWLSAASAGFSMGNDLKLYDVESPAVVTFKEALELGVQNNIKLKKENYGITIADSNAKMALGKLLPSLTLMGSYQVNNHFNALDDGTKAAISLRATLLDAKSILDLLAKKQLTEVAKENYVYEQDVLLKDVGELYIEAAIALATKDIAFEEAESLKKQIPMVKKRAVAGSARNFDVTMAEYRARKANADYVLKNQDFVAKMGALGNKIGMHKNFLLSIVGIESPHLKLEPSVLIAMANTATDVVKARTEVKAAEASLLAEKFDFFPRLKAEVVGGFPFLFNDSGKFLRVGDFGATMMINLEFPLSSGGSTLAAIKNKFAAKASCELSLLSKTTEKALSINSLKQQLVDFDIVKESANSALELAVLAKESVDRLFTASEATVRELMDASTNLFSAKNQLSTATLRLEQTKLRLLFEVGHIKDLL